MATRTRDHECELMLKSEVCIYKWITTSTVKMFSHTFIPLSKRFLTFWFARCKCVGCLVQCNWTGNVNLINLMMFVWINSYHQTRFWTSWVLTKQQNEEQRRGRKLRPVTTWRSSGRSFLRPRIICMSQQGVHQIRAGVWDESYQTAIDL